MNDPKHYRLTNKEWLELSTDLTFGEMKVLMHLRTIDPFADRFKEADTKEIAEQLKITQRTVQRALISLSTKELIDLEFTGFRFRLRSKVATPTSPNDTHVASDDTHVATPTSPDDTHVASDDTHVATPTSPDDTHVASRDIHVARTTPTSPVATSTSQKRHPCRDRKPEALLSNGLEGSHTIKTNKTNSDFKKERERDAREREEKTVENFLSEPDFEGIPDQPNQSTQTPTRRIQSSAAQPSPQNFDFNAYNWANYDQAGAGGSDRGYWDWAIAQIKTFDSARQSKGDPEIGDIASYTLATIRNRGPAGYAKYLQSIGVSTATNPSTTVPMRTRQPDLICSRPLSIELKIYDDLSEEIATIQTVLTLRSWGWVHPQIQLWVCTAQEFSKHYGWPPIQFEPALGCSNWPDWAIAKLAEDLEATCTNL